MSDKSTGNVVPNLMLEEHSHVANAKRVVPMGLLDNGSDYSTFTIFDYTNSNPIAVVLVEPTTGDAYTATAGGGGGGGSGNVTLVGSTITLPVEVTNNVDVTLTGQPVNVDVIDTSFNVTVAGFTVTLRVDVTNDPLNVSPDETFTPASTAQTFTAKYISDAPVQIVGTQLSRKSIVIQADFNNSLSVFIGNTTTDLDDVGQEIRAGGVYSDSGDGVWNGQIWGQLSVNATTSTMSVRIWERT